VIDRFSGVLGLFAFFLAATLGIVLDHPADQVLFSSLIAMVTFIIIGKVIGFFAGKIIAEVVATIPEEELAGIEAEELVEGKAAVVAEPGQFEEPVPPPAVQPQAAPPVPEAGKNDVKPDGNEGPPSAA